jgi:recombinational DNA repair ATPase RecF
MKIQRIRIENFKGLRALDLDLRAPEGAPRPVTALLGDNASGKTTVLQAVALTLSLATRRTRQPSDLAWHGFLAERVSSLGQTRVELEVMLTSEEVQTTANLFREAGAGVFRTRLRDFVIGNPGAALDVLPEWRGLLELLRK